MGYHRNLSDTTASQPQAVQVAKVTAGIKESVHSFLLYRLPFMYNAEMICTNDYEHVLHAMCLCIDNLETC